MTRTGSGTFDSRREPRVAIRIHVTYEDSEGQQHAQTADISSGGMFIATARAPETGTRLALTLEHQDHPYQVTVSAEVMRIVPNREGGTKGFGIRFVDLDDEKRRGLDALVRSARQADGRAVATDNPDLSSEGEEDEAIVPGLPRRELATGFAYLSPELIPLATEGVDLHRQPLTTHEGYVMSLVDGQCDVNQIRQSCNLDLAQMSEALINLAIKGVVRFLQPPPPASDFADEDLPRTLPGFEGVGGEDVATVPGMRAGDLQSAPQAATPRPKSAKEKEAERIYARGLEEYELARYDRAMIYFNMAATFFPDEGRYREMYNRAQLARLGKDPGPLSDENDSQEVSTIPGVKPVTTRIPAQTLETPEPEPEPEPFDRERALRVSTARGFYDHARDMEKAGRPDEAVRLLERAIETAPEVGEFYNRLGLVYYKYFRNARRAEEFSRKALEVAPDNAVFASNFRKIKRLVGGDEGGRGVWQLGKE